MTKVLGMVKKGQFSSKSSETDIFLVARHVL